MATCIHDIERTERSGKTPLIVLLVELPRTQRGDLDRDSGFAAAEPALNYVAPIGPDGGDSGTGDRV